MPTWINHFRVVDKLLDKINTLDLEYFIIGTIAPDCGIIDGDHGVYKPYTGVTHFTSELEYSKKTDCNYEYVYQTYIKDESDIKKKSFYIAYFIHLIIDCVFANDVFTPIEKEYGDFRTNEKLRCQVRAERNNIDFSFVNNNTSASFEIFKTCKPWRENYPEWYKNNEIAIQMKNIINHYQDRTIKNIEYKYLTPELMEKFIDVAYETVIDELNKRNIELWFKEKSMVREITNDDIDGLLELYLDLHESVIPEFNNTLKTTWENILNDENHHIIVYVIDEQIVSSCVCVIIPNLTRGVRPYAFIENVVTKKEHRGKGYATFCLKFAEEIAKQNNCYKMMLLTGSKNESTLSFYKNAGYNSADKTAFIQWLD